MEHSKDNVAQALNTPPPAYAGTGEDGTGPTTSSGTGHTLEFRHRGCPSCDTSLAADDHPVAGGDYHEVRNMMLSRAYDVMDIFHADGPAIRDLRLSAIWTETGRFTDMDSMGHEERESLLDILKGGKDNYRLRVEFTTFPRQTEGLQEALEPGAVDTAADGLSRPMVEGNEEGA